MQNETATVQSEDLHAAYGTYKLRTAQNYIYVLAIIVSMLSVILIICDINLMDEQAPKLIVAVVRYTFAVLIIFASGWLTRMKSFQRYATVVSLLELCSIAISMFVLTQYKDPNFLIQSMGVIATILVIYLVPNRKGYQLSLALLAALSFYAFTYVYVKDLIPNDVIASIAYTTIAIVLCSVSAFNNERNQLREFIAKNRLEQMSTTDFLTNTANRFRLEEEADRWMSFCRRQRLPLCLVFVDVDNLKQINDTFGHIVGDSVLVTLSDLMQKQLRNSDTISRWGGDEFVLLLPNISLKNAVMLLERLKISVLKVSFGTGVKVTCSYGVVEMGDESSFQTMIREADALMYSGKRDGKDRISYLMPDE